jgi:putative ABC transport system ATP-binding protein
MIHIEQLAFRYDRQVILHIPYWQLQQGEQCLFLGNSGSGKSTLLHLLAGLLQPHTGTITIAHTQLHRLKSAQMDAFRGKNIGLVFQKPHLVGAMSVRENLLLAQYAASLPVDARRADDVLNELNLSHRKGAKVYQLSQGEAQRVTIARALLNKPKVILADEPTSSLDDDNCEAVLGLLQKQANKYGATLAISTHDQRIKNRFSKHLHLGTVQGQTIPAG